MTRPATAPRWAKLSAILIGTFVGTLGNSVANVAVPAIMADFGVPLSSAVWVVSLYVLTFAVLMPVSGYLGDLYGYRRLYLLGLSVYLLASLGAGLAPSLAWLLGCRVLMGIGISPTLPAVMAIISRSFSPDERGRAMGYWALANGAGHAFGPPLSGFLTQEVSWRSVFLVGGVPALLSLGMVWALVPPDEARTRRRFDLPGAVTLTITALGLMLSLTQSTRWGWGSPLALGLWAVTAGALIGFVWAERRSRSPFVDLSLFADGRYRAAMVVIAAQYFCLFGLLLAVPLFLIQVQGRSEQVAGWLVLPLPLLAAFLAPLAGRLADRRGSRWACSWGMGLVALTGLAWLQVAGPEIPWWALVLALVGMGLGMGFIQSPVTAAVTQVVRADRLGVATGIFHMGRFVSGSLGSMVFGLVLQMEAAGMAAGFRHDLGLVVAVAGGAVLAAQWLPDRRVVPRSSAGQAGDRGCA